MTVDYRHEISYRFEMNRDGATVYVSRKAGVCGPAENTDTSFSTLYEADLWIAQQGYTRTGDWQISTTYSGLEIAADLALSR